MNGRYLCTSQSEQTTENKEGSNKAVLVIDVPESCAKCPLFGNHYSDMCCKASNNRSIDYPYPKNFRQSWCPLQHKCSND